MRAYRALIINNDKGKHYGKKSGGHSTDRTLLTVFDMRVRLSTAEKLLHVTFMDGDTVVLTQQVEKGKKIESYPSVYREDEYDFLDGWCTDKELTQVWDDSVERVTKEANFSACANVYAAVLLVLFHQFRKGELLNAQRALGQGRQYGRGLRGELPRTDRHNRRTVYSVCGCRHGMADRNLAVRQPIVRRRSDDDTSAHIQPIFLQQNGQGVFGRVCQLHDFHNDDVAEHRNVSSSAVNKNKPPQWVGLKTNSALLRSRTSALYLLFTIAYSFS